MLGCRERAYSDARSLRELQGLAPLRQGGDLLDMSFREDTPYRKLVNREGRETSEDHPRGLTCSLSSSASRCSSSDFSGLSLEASPSLNSSMPRPRPRPSSGRRLAPKNKRTMARRITNSPPPILGTPGIM